MISIITDKNLSSGAKVLLMFITASGDNTYTYKDFVDGTGLSKPTIARCIKELLDGGYISRYRTMRDGSYQEYIFYSTSKDGVPECKRKMFVYVQRLSSPNLTIGKVGIAVNPEMRKRQQRNGSCFKHDIVFSAEFDTHEEAYEVEQSLLESLIRYDCDKNWLPNGYTETILESEIPKAIEMIKEKQNERNA